MSRQLLTFDLGTTLFKLALFDESGRMLAVRRTEPNVLHPQPGWSELDPHAFSRTLVQAAGDLRKEVGGFEKVVAVSFATQANSFVLLDERDEPLTPIILWSDQRATDVSEELAAIGRTAGFRDRTGMPRFGPSLGLAKALRWKHQNPLLLEQTRRLCYVSDLFTLWMTGQPLTEGGVAAISGAMDLRSFAWWDDLLAQVGVRTSQMSAIVRAGRDLGTVREDIAREIDLPLSCRFIVGCLDQYAGAIGTGTIEPGQICETTGTVLAAVRCSDRIDMTRPDEVFHGPTFDEDKFFQMSFSSTSANLLEWYRNSLPDTPSFEELSRLAGEADDAVTIEPYREGEPIESCFRRVGKGHSVGQIVRGIMRCVAGALKRQIESLSPAIPPVIRSAGGAARSDVWLQLKADTLGTTFEAIDCEEPTSLGAAMLAARAVTGRSMAELARDWVRVRKTFTPQRGTGASPVQK